MNLNLNLMRHNEFLVVDEYKVKKALTLYSLMSLKMAV